MYADIQQPELIKGIKYWKNKNGFNILMLHYTADPTKDPDINPEWKENEKMGLSEAKWNKEYEIDFTSKSGKRIFGKEFCDFDENVHFIQSFEMDTPSEFLFSLDFGQRNPTAGLVGAWTKDNSLYIIDEYYKPALPSVSSKDMMKKFSYLLPGIEDARTIREKRNIINVAFPTKVIDPSTTSKNRTKIIQGEEIEYSVIEEFEDHGWEFEPAMNNVEASITRIREYFAIDSNHKSRLYIFKDKCPVLCKELVGYKYKENTEATKRTHNESEEPVKKDDHTVDALRYMIMTRPYPFEAPEKPKTRVQQDIENILNNKYKDIPSWDI